MPSSLLGQQPYTKELGRPHQELRIHYPTSLLCPRPFPRAQLTTALNYECTSCDLERGRVWTLTLLLSPLLRVTGPQQQPKGTQLIVKYNCKFKNHF